MFNMIRPKLLAGQCYPVQLQTLSTLNEISMWHHNVSKNSWHIIEWADKRIKHDYFIDNACKLVVK